MGGVQIAQPVAPHDIGPGEEVSTTPLRSGLVPLAPVGPPNSVRLSQACHGLVRQMWRFMRGGMSHACETLEQGGFLACRQRPAVKCSLLALYSAKTRTRYSPGQLYGSPLT